MSSPFDMTSDEQKEEELATEVLNRITEIFMEADAQKGDGFGMPFEVLPRMLKDIMEGNPVIIDMNTQSVNVLKYNNVHIKKGNHRYYG